MGFSTNMFLFLFFPLFLMFFLICNSNYRKYILLLFSLIFYMWSSTKSIIIILIVSLINFLLGYLIDFFQNQYKKLIVRIGVLLNLLLLIVFKYTGFLGEIINTIGHLNISIPAIILPLGLSYFSFSAISYIIDIGRGDIVHEKNFFRFLLYIVMFPKITAGPIIRYKDISNQLTCEDVTLSHCVEGAKRFCIGLAKKVLIADQLGLIVDEIFSIPARNHLISTVWLGAICYTLQIYHDFSGYSDMAIGIGKICGFDFKENFNYPYISKSLTEFWRRWHISLSSWFRDYLYIPLGGNRRGNVYLNLSIVFLATGLWHGSSWHFVIWGIWNGLFIVSERMLKKHVHLSLPSVFRHLYTILIVIIGWVFFRCNTTSMGIEYVLKMFGIGNTQIGFKLQWYLSPKIIVLLIIGGMCSIPWKNIFKKKMDSLSYVFCILLLLFSIMVIMGNTYNSFIYFKF